MYKLEGMDPILLFGGVVAAHDEMSDPSSPRVEVIEKIRAMIQEFATGFNHRILVEELVEYSGSVKLMKFYENAGRLGSVQLCCQLGYLDLLKYIYENNTRLQAKIKRSTEFICLAYRFNQPEVLEWLLIVSKAKEIELSNLIDRLIKIDIPENSYKILEIMSETQLMGFNPFEYFLTMDKRCKSAEITFDDFENYLVNHNVTVNQLDYLFKEFKTQEVVFIYLNRKREKMSVELFERFYQRVNFNQLFDTMYSFQLVHLLAIDYENLTRDLINIGLDIPRYFNKTILTNISYIWGLPEYFHLCEPHLIGQFAVDHLFENGKYELLEKLGSPTPVRIGFHSSTENIELAVQYFFRPGFNRIDYLEVLNRAGQETYNRFIAVCTPEQREIVERT